MSSASSTLASESVSPASAARRSLVLLLVLNLLTYMDRQVLAGVESLIARDLLPNDPNAQTKMGFLATAFLVSYMAFSPVFGVLGDRTSRWLLVALGTIIGSLATGATGLAATFLGVLTARIFVGVSEAAYAPVAPTILADLYPVQRRGQILAFFYAAIPVGSALGYTWGGLIADHLSWHWAFLLLAPPGIVAGIIALFFKDPRMSEVRGQVSDGKASSPPAGSSTPETPGLTTDASHLTSHISHRTSDLPSRPRWETYLALFRIRSYSLNVAGQTAMTFALGGIAFWMPRYIHQRYQIEIDPKATLGPINFLFGVICATTGLAATLFGGFLGDRLRTRLPGSYFLVSSAGMLAGFPLFLATLYVPFPYAWVPLALAVFCLFLNTGPSNTALANVTPPPSRTTAFALSIFTIHALGDAISPPLIGAVADRHSLHTALLLTSTTFLLASLFWFLASKHLAPDTAKVQAEYPDSGPASTPLQH